MVQADKSFSINVPGADLVADPDKTIQASVSTTDAAGNTASASDTEGYGVDASAPAVTVDILDASLNVADRVSEVSFTFTQAPVGFTLDDITATNGTLSNLQPTSDLLVFTATFTAKVGFEGDGQVSVAAGSYTNAAGNPGSAGSDTVNIDTTPPELSITLDANITADDIINQAEAGQNIPITGVVEGDAKVDDTVTLTVNGNTFTGLVQAGKTFSIEVPGADLVADPDKTIQASVSTTDAAGNTASASDTEGYQVDTAPPVPTITLGANITADDIINQAEAGQNIPITGVVAGDAKVGDTVTLTVNGKTFTGLVQADKSFSINVPGADLVADPDKTIQASVSTTDAAGNTASASDTEGYGVDASAPAVTVDILDASLNVADRVSEVSFTFTQAPVGFTLDDITATNGTLSNLQPTSDLLVFTATFTAKVGFEGDGQVSVAAGSYTNAAGNPGSAGSDTVNIDTTPPELSITLDANITADDIINQAEAGQNIPITGVVAGDAKVGDTVTLTVNGNTFTGLVQAGKTFSIEVPGADLVADPDKTIQASVSTTDAAGNTASASDTEGYQVDTAPPVPTITLGANITADDIINQAEADQNIPITGVVAGDAKVGDTVTLTVNGNTFTGLVQANKSFSINVPGADLVADPDKTIQASVSTTDAAGNTASASDTEGYGVDASAPAVTVNILDASLNVADRVSEVSFTFTQAPVGFTLDDITATNGTLSNLQPTSDLLVFTATFTAKVGFEGDGQVSVAAGSYTNAAGNPGSAGSDTVNIDTTPPELSITLDANITADDIINQAEAGQNIPITGVVEGDAKVGDTVTLTVNGNTFTGLVQAGKTFSIEVPGADLVADPDKTIQASVSTTDAAGNTASASDTEGYQVDTAPPGDVYLTSQTKEIGNLGLSGEYFGHNDNRTGAANDTLYSGTTATRLHSDDGKFGNVDSLADVERIIEDRNGNADLVGSTASGAAKADATFSANKLEFGLHSGSNTPLFSNDLGQNGKVETGSIGAKASSGSANNLYNFLKVTSGNADALAATSGLGDTTDAVIRMVGYIYIPAGGAYDLRITADDGYRVRIGGQDLAQADYIQQTTTKVYSNQPISEGMQPIEILYWDQGGHASLRVEVKSSGTADATYKIIGNDEFALFSPSDLPALTANQDIVESATNGVWAVRTGETYTGTEASEKVIGSNGRDTIHTGAGNDTVNAGAGNDTVNAGDGADVISGGAGNDLLTGGLGSDTFVWALADQGIMGAPARDTITDFNTASHTAGGDVLDLRDLLTGENHTSGTGNLTSYLHFEKTGSDTVVHISRNGEFSSGFSAAKDVQTITLSGVDLIGSSSTDQQVIQSLLNNHKLITD
ncbi:hypothetical protein M2244_001294 [Rhodoferax antarcticus]|nr:hypothetical protein [Rhodoferax antarcticus]